MTTQPEADPVRLDGEACHLVDYAATMAKAGRPAHEILTAAAYVFTAEWSLLDRLRLAVLVLTAGIR